MNKSSRIVERSKQINSTNAKPRKKIKLSVSNTNSNSSQHPKPPKPQPSNIKTKPKSASKQLLASKWRWSPPRRKLAVEQAVDCRLFDIKITDGRRDAKIACIVANMNKMTDIDINFALLTIEHYTKEIYRIQRKVLKIDDEQLDLLPKEEQTLFQQLKSSGEVEEARLTQMSANSS